MKKNSLWELYSHHKKLLTIMKITFLLCIVGTLTITAANTYSQETKISLNLKNVTISELLKEISNKSEFSIWVNTSMLDNFSKVSLDVKDQTVDKILDLAMGENSNLDFLIKDRVIIIYSKDHGKGIVNLVQQQKITGTVSDATTGEPIIGANVVVEGTTDGAVTDTNGGFTLDVPNSNALLLVTFIGYNTEKVAIAGQSTLDIKLVPDITKLEEIVVVGYGTKKKRDVIG
ncbi:MAG: hypothetical protein HC831_15430 [Chloroflexia bacterium]|nr:hypothetical protein [Chloroflexia bacterium]